MSDPNAVGFYTSGPLDRQIREAHRREVGLLMESLELAFRTLEPADRAGLLAKLCREYGLNLCP